MRSEEKYRKSGLKSPINDDESDYDSEEACKTPVEGIKDVKIFGDDEFINLKDLMQSYIEIFLDKADSKMQLAYM